MPSAVSRDLSQVAQNGSVVEAMIPPLISGQPEFDTIETILRSVLTDTGRKYLHL